MESQREELLAKVTQALPHLKKINELMEQREQIEKKMRRDPFQTPRILFAVLFAVFGGIYFFAEMCYVEVRDTHLSLKHILITMIPTVLVLIILFLLKQGRTLIKQKYVRNIDLVNSEIMEVVRISRDKIAIFPEMYRYYTAAVYIHQVLANGRAESLKEALNLYEDQLHRWRIEKAQSQLVMIANQQTAILKAMQLNTSISAIDCLLR